MAEEVSSMEAAWVLAPSARSWLDMDIWSAAELTWVRSEERRVGKEC